MEKVYELMLGKQMATKLPKNKLLTQGKIMDNQTNEIQHAPISPVITIETKIGRIDEGVGAIGTRGIDSSAAAVFTTKLDAAATKESVGKLQLHLEELDIQVVALRSDLCTLSQQLTTQAVELQALKDASDLLWVKNTKDNEKNRKDHFIISVIAYAGMTGVLLLVAFPKFFLGV